MKKYFIVTDVHGHYYEMWKALNDKGFDINNNDHVFVSLGDLLDRGDKPKECLEYVLTIPRNRCILIRGNHEDLIQDLMDRGYSLSHDIHNGTLKTLYDLTNFNDITDEVSVIAEAKTNYHLNLYLSLTIPYFELENHIFVHGWIPCYVNNNLAIRIELPNLHYWKDASWLNGMEMWKKGAKHPTKTVCCGHWHTSYGHANIHNKCLEFGKDAIFDPFIDEGIIALDTCTALTKKVNCYVIEDNLNYYVDKKG